MKSYHHGRKYTGPRPCKLLPGEETVEKSKIRRCKYCRKDITWLESASGKFYAVNVPGQVSHNGQMIIARNDFHHCEKRT